MRTARLAAALAATLTVLATPGTARAATIVQDFSADSGDSCPYGVTTGTLSWSFGTSPLPVRGVQVSGQLRDRPLFADPGRVCLDDGFASQATFAAYSAGVEVERQSVVADNAVVRVDLTLGANAKAVDLVVIQVCRDSTQHLPPSRYCGKPVSYPAPPVA